MKYKKQKQTLNYYCKLLGYKPKQNPRNYWLNEDNIIKELKLVCNDIGKFPTKEDMKKLNKYGLWLGIHKNNKPIQYYQNLLRYDNKRRENGYWTEETIRKELKRIISESGDFPTQLQLRKSGNCDLAKAIDRLNLSYSDLQEEFGFEPKEKPKKYWLDWDNLTSELRKIIRDNKFPTLSMILYNGCGSAIAGIMKFGGINEVADKMGYDPPFFKKTTDGHFVHSSYEYIFDEWLHSNKIPHIYNGLINKNHRYLFDFKINDFYVEIWGYNKEDTRENTRNGDYNKKRAVKEKLYKYLNLKLISIEGCIFKQLHHQIEEHFYNLMKTNGVL